jgi:NTE family protein
MRLNNKLYINYFLEGVFDNLNKNHFPTAGQYVSFRYTLHTDNFYQMNDDIPLNVLNVRCLKPLKITDKWYITPEISGRSFFHAPDSIPLIYSNFVGGKFDGHYLPQQIALPGSGGMEILRNAFLKIQTNIHYQLTSKQCVYANLNVSAHNDKALKIFDGQYFTGANIGYSHLTVVGPLAVEIGYSDLSKKVHAYLGIGHYF